MKSLIFTLAPKILVLMPESFLIVLVRIIPALAYVLPSGIKTMFTSYLGGYRISIDTQYPIERKLLSGMYDRDVTETILREVKPGDICLDIGANVGVMTFAMVKAGAAQVLAFEPGPLVRGRLRDNLAFNPDVQKKVEIHGVGLDQIPGTLFWNNQPLANAGNATLNPQDLSGEGIRVDVVTLDGTIPGKKIDFIKIDVEGMEYRVLSGGQELLKKNHPKILFETNRGHGDENLKLLCRMLEDLGYDLYDVKGQQKKRATYPNLASNCIAIWKGSDGA